MASWRAADCVRGPFAIRGRIGGQGIASGFTPHSVFGEIDLGAPIKSRVRVSHRQPSTMWASNPCNRCQPYHDIGIRDDEDTLW